MSDTGNSGTRAERLRARVKGAYDAFSGGDMDAFFTMLAFADDAVMIEPDGLPYGGCYRGADAIRKGIESAIAAWTDNHVKIEDVAASENLVYVYMHAFCRGPKTGKSYAFPIVEVLRFRGEECVEFRPFYFDTVRAREVAGG